MLAAYIGLGSNLGDSKVILQDAWAALGDEEGVELDCLSSPYVTAPVDMTSQHWFTNAVGRVRTSLEPQELLQRLLSVETSFGRTRDRGSFGYQDRSLDLDLLYVGRIVLDSPELILPHPRIEERMFVLVPLAEIAVDFVDFASGRPILELIDRLNERLVQSPQRKQEIIHSTWTD